MQPRFPDALKKGSTVGLICPSGGFDDYRPVKKALKYLKELGYNPRPGSSLINSKKFYKYLAGDDKDRLQDFLDFWFDKDVHAIFCLKGGYGSMRLLEHIDFNKLMRHKKILIGFSDVTALLLAVYAKTRLITFHGPMLGADFIGKKLKPKDQASERSMFKLISDPYFRFSYNSKEEGYVINPGVTHGYLIGGNLTLICSLVGTEYLPDFKNTILFLEDINEEPYTIDRMLTQLKYAGILDKLRGMVICSFYNSGFKSRKHVAKLMKDRLGAYKVPIIYYFPCGHGSKNFTLPIGRKVFLDADRLLLRSLD